MNLDMSEAYEVGVRANVPLMFAIDTRKFYSVNGLFGGQPPYIVAKFKDRSGCMLVGSGRGMDRLVDADILYTGDLDAAIEIFLAHTRMS